MNRHTELRKLPAGSLTNISNILETNNDWQRIAMIIPKDLQSEHFERKYNNEHIGLIEKHARENKRKCAEVLFDEWGTSGRVRPTLENLMKILEQAQIYRAADVIADLLGETPPPRPAEGPAAIIPIHLTDLLNNESMEQILDSIETIDSANLHNSSHDHVACNRTTKQLTKEPSNLMQFSASSKNMNVPDISALQSGGYKKGVSDMIKFSVTQSENITGNVPAISDLLQHSPAYENNSVSTIPTESGNTESSLSCTTNSSTQNDISQFIPNVNPSYSKSNIDIFDIIDMTILEDKRLVPFEYKELETITDKFSDTFINKPSGPVGKIGSGGFGDVYVGMHKNHGALAVKRVRIFYQMGCEMETAIKIFNTEVKSLSYLRHENIVPIFGYSIDGPTPCIVCKYIDGGSLQERIAKAKVKGTDEVLSEYQRINIMKGTAEGLKYIHHSERPQQTDEILDEFDSSSRKSYFLHGDVKSANILLTKDCVPKLCDFGLAKQLDTTLITKSMMGTSAYMAPEGFSGTVTQKNDIFSFGIVLLELLTGLKPIFIVNGENLNIKNFVEDRCRDGDITPLLDRVVPNWTRGQKIYDLASQCLEYHKNDRPSIDQVCISLNDISNKPCDGHI